MSSFGAHGSGLGHGRFGPSTPRRPAGITDEAWERHYGEQMEEDRARVRAGIGHDGESPPRALPALPPPPAKLSREAAARVLARGAADGGKEIPVDVILTNPAARTRAFRAAAVAHHPDTGGDAEKMVELVDARELLDELGP